MYHDPAELIDPEDPNYSTLADLGPQKTLKQIIEEKKQQIIDDPTYPNRDVYMEYIQDGAIETLSTEEAARLLDIPH